MKIGLIGTGNMGSALMGGYLTANPDMKDSVLAFDVDKGSLAAFVEKSGAKAAESLKDLALESDLLLLAVKPQTVCLVLDDIKDLPGIKEKIIVSIAAGIKLEYIYECLEYPNAKVVRAMPNTPAMVGKGMTALVRGQAMSDDDFNRVKEIFLSVGGVEESKEELIHSVIGVSGSAPAYVYMFIEALADGAVALGMDRKQAYKFAAGTVAGAAEMVLKSGLHPGELKDNVCSPGGTTIEAVRVLEAKGFRSAVMEAVKAAGDKSNDI